MKDYQKVCAIYFCVFGPVLLLLVLLLSSSYSITMTRFLSMFELMAMILSFAIAVLVCLLHPRLKHYRKAMYEFEENYVYEEDE